MKSARLGQNFLVNHNVAEKIVDAFAPVEGQVLEIGPGHGILTEYLLDHLKEDQFTTVEIDSHLAEKLEKKYTGRLKVLCGDILELDLSEVFGGNPVNIIGNLPYQISKRIIDWMIMHQKKITKGIVMLQKEFVDKLLSVPGNESYMAQSAVFQEIFSSKKLFTVSPGSFRPVPRVHSTVFSFSSNTQHVDIQRLYRFFQLVFRERRKTLFNNLIPHFEPESVRIALEQLGISRMIRGEQLPPRNLKAIYLLLSNDFQGE
jgi:16S rRNA (adenine1518-N6/adenine1519-N6)-dimethyltransferase